MVSRLIQLCISSYLSLNIVFLEYSSGYYLKNFAKGIESALEDYYNDIVRLEANYAKSKTNSLIYIFNTLDSHLPLILFLRKLITDARMQVRLYMLDILTFIYYNVIFL